MTRSGSPWVIAHRGASRDRPENTRASFDEALRQGCDGFELDVQLSRDGVPVVYHDRTLTRAGGGRRRVRSLDLRDLRRLEAGTRFGDAYRRERIPTLDEVLRRYGKRTLLLVEIKTGGGRTTGQEHLALARAVARCLRENRLQRKAFVLCFDREVLGCLEDEAPKIQRVMNLRPPRRMSRSIADRLERLSALSVDVRTLTQPFAAAVRREGRPLFVYTCNTLRHVRRAEACGARAIMSDRPGWLGKQLAGRESP